MDHRVAVFEVEALEMKDQVIARVIVAEAALAAVHVVLLDAMEAEAEAVVDEAAERCRLLTHQSLSIQTPLT